ncbi:unnamed protein product [Durusdinium trenchii]|uniref:TIR domain-containing protein n=1 Tax=Durusdinium trenchii TaxID=1381693 RepID=A0ABP0P399_9DINO
MAHLLDGWKARNTRGSYPPFQRPTNREDFSMPVRQSESSPSAVEKLEKMAQELQSPSALQKRSRMEASEKDQPVPGGAEDRIRKMNRDLEEKWGLTDTSSSRPAETPQPSLTKTVSPKAFQAEARRYDDSSWAAKERRAMFQASMGLGPTLLESGGHMFQDPVKTKTSPLTARSPFGSPLREDLKGQGPTPTRSDYSLEDLAPLSRLKPGLRPDVSHPRKSEIDPGFDTEVASHKNISILMIVPKSVSLHHKPTVEIIDVGKTILPKGVVPASPFIQLKPEGVTFPKPVRLLVPVCYGANAAWRSTPDGSWEEVPAQFRGGYMEVYLTHFCQLCASKVVSALSIKAVAFLKPGSPPEATLAFLEVNCQQCEDQLAQLVPGLVRCLSEEAVDLFSPERDLHILQQGQVIETLRLDGNSGVQISSWIPSSADRMDIEMEVVDTKTCRRRIYTFEFPAEATPDPPPPPPPPLPPLPVPPPVPIIQNPVPPPVTQVLPPPSPPPSPPRYPEPPRRHLMLSGRFNTPERLEYIKDVKDELASRGIETFMVEEPAGGRFGQATMEGVVKMKVMVAFCVDDYGAKTGAMYETYWELLYAWENQVPIIPVKLYEGDWPPMPPDEAGRIQNKYVFSKSLIYIDGHEKTRQEVAEQIAKALERLRI